MTKVITTLPDGTTRDDQGHAYDTVEDARQAVIDEILRRLRAFHDGSDRRCVHCDREVKHVRKVGRCCYAWPCGCRLYQGNPPKWVKR